MPSVFDGSPARGGNQSNSPRGWGRPVGLLILILVTIYIFSQLVNLVPTNQGTTNPLSCLIAGLILLLGAILTFFGGGSTNDTS